MLAAASPSATARMGPPPKALRGTTAGGSARRYREASEIPERDLRPCMPGLTGDLEKDCTLWIEEAPPRRRAGL